MTILAAGGEDICFTLTASWAVQTGGTTYRSNFARCALGMSLNNPSPSTADPPAQRITSAAFGAVSNLWIHGQWGQTVANNSNVANSTMMRALNAGTARIAVRGTGTAGQVKIDKRDAAGTFTTLATSASGAIPAQTGAHQYDLWIDYRTTGQVVLYLDGVAIADSGAGVDVTTNGATTLDQVEWCVLGPNANLVGAWSEMIAADTDTKAMALWTLQPVAAGNTQSWTPNTVGNINEVTKDDATNVSSNTNNALSQWTTPTAYPAGQWNLRAVKQDARISRGGGGPQQFQFVCRTIDAVDNVSATVALTTSLANYEKIWGVNPSSGAAWAAADIASGFNLGVKAIA